MNELDFNDVRRAHTTSRHADPRLLAVLRECASALVRWGGLPASYAPYGIWNAEAEDEVFQGWVTESLIERGNLQALLDVSADVESFRRLAERSLRQYLLDARTRSQSQNLYRRIAHLLESDAAFHRFRDASKKQNVAWGLAAWRESSPTEFAGDDRELLAYAWALGDFSIVRFKADAKKLSPLLAAAELRRFLVGLFERSHGLLTLSRIMRALELRFNLDDVHEVSLDSVPEPTSEDHGAEELIIDETADAILVELTPRQADVLFGSVEEDTIDELANRLRCSVGTIVNEQRRIAEIVDRHTSDASDRERLMRKIADLLYEEGDDDD